MSKLDDAQAKARKILESLDHSQSSQTEVNIQSNSQQTSTGDADIASSETSADHSANHAPVGNQVNATDDEVGPDSDQVAELTVDLQRLQAEFVNYKRRAENQAADVTDFTKARVVREFLTVRDSFDQELAHRPGTVDPTWASSIDAIRAQFDKVLVSLGVERFVSLGQPFDPHIHEAIASDGSGEVVTEELQAGYKLGATILRHAMVKVGAAPDSK